MAKNIVDKGRDHLLTEKGNQPRLFSKLNEIFDVKTLNTAKEKVFSQSNVIRAMGGKKQDII